MIVKGRNVPYFAMTLKNYRSERGLSLRDLSARTGVGCTSLHNLEVGRNGPTLKTLQKLARGTGVPIEELLYPNDEIGN